MRRAAVTATACGPCLPMPANTTSLTMPLSEGQGKSFIYGVAAYKAFHALHRNKLPACLPAGQGKHFTWGQWSSHITVRPQTGLAMFDIRFAGERIIYELAMQDQFVQYSGFVG